MPYHPAPLAFALQLTCENPVSVNVMIAKKQCTSEKNRGIELVSQ
jgi:hypothetical protein